MPYINIKKPFLIMVSTVMCLTLSATSFADDDDGIKMTVVNCNKSNASVQRKLDRANRNRSVTIVIEGYCDESVTITRDDVTLRGDPKGDGEIEGGLREVRVVGARRVHILNLELTGDGYGMLAVDGAVVNVAACDIHDNTFDGIGAFNMAFVRVTGSDIVRNGRPAPFFEAGIDVSGASIVRSAGNYIAGNNYAAVEVGNMSYFRSGFFTAGAPPDPADLDIVVQKGCSQGDPAGTCGEDGTVAIDCYRNGVCDFRNSDVTGVSYISGLSNFDVRTTVINGNIFGSGGARLHLRGSVTGSGFVGCGSEAFASAFTPCGGFLPP